MFILPFSDDPAQNPAQTFTTTLGSTKYTIDARYNDRSGVWTFDLTRASDQTLLVAGVPILIGQDLLAPYALGIGGIIAADLSGANVDAGAEDLGTRVQVAWLSVDELVTFAAGGVVL